MASLCATTTSVAFSTSSLVIVDSRQLLSTSSAVSVSSPSLAYPAVRCGRGDSRTAKGKRFKGSFGNARPKDPSKGKGLAVTEQNAWAHVINRVGQDTALRLATTAITVRSARIHCCVPEIVVVCSKVCRSSVSPVVNVITN
ncbi:hypothetical protein R1flu_018145 [Riccia fluitans]|uniref:Uncharacterized protein n=1 Tax=Riccia fluitans TaxID=41844 RepID=A0ABD1ZG10_9MARC